MAESKVTSAAEFARFYLRRAILAGEYPPGTQLVEAELANSIGVSRGPVREAVRELAAENLVELRRNKSAVVAKVDAQDVLEVYAMRAVLGTLALRQLVARPETHAQVVKRLEAAARKTKTSEARNDRQVFVDADLGFQNEIASSSDLPRVASVFRQLSAEAFRFVNVLDVKYTEIDRILQENDALIDAIRNSDLRRAEQVWQGRFRRAVHEFIEALDEPDAELDHWPQLVTLVENPGSWLKAWPADAAAESPLEHH